MKRPVDYRTARIVMDDRAGDFEAARRLAEQEAEALLGMPMLIAWCDAVRAEESPRVPECTGEPGWLAYAKGHGIHLLVDVNGGDYQFAYTDAAA